MTDQTQFCDWSEQVQEFVRALRNGLSEFCCYSVRIAVTTQLVSVGNSDRSIWVFDPEDLLGPHRESLRNYFDRGYSWRAESNEICFGQDHSFVSPELDDIIVMSRQIMFNALEGVAISIYVDNVEGVVAGPIIEWLQTTATILAGEIADRAERTGDPFRVRSEQSVQLFAREAIGQYTAKLCTFHEDNWKNLLLIDRILRLVLDICSTTEEKRLASGAMLFVSLEKSCEQRLLVEFSDPQPLLSQVKRVTKVLKSLPDKNHCLVCNTALPRLNIVGISTLENSFSNTIRVEFHQGLANLIVNGKQVCRIVKGKYVAAGIDVGLNKIRDALNEMVGSSYEELCDVIRKLSDAAMSVRHGCTIVLDFSESIEQMSGQYFEQPLNLVNDEEMVSIAAAMSSIDGALHISHDGRFHAFSCLLDGSRLDDENLERGARYNSALRFARSRSGSVLVVVISEDGLFSVFNRDGEYFNEPDVVTLDYLLPSKTLSSWLNE